MSIQQAGADLIRLSDSSSRRSRDSIAPAKTVMPSRRCGRDVRERVNGTKLISTKVEEFGQGIEQVPGMLLRVSPTSPRLSASDPSKAAYPALLIRDQQQRP